MASVTSIAISDRPVLHLSGPKLRAALERLVRSCEAQGGVEQFSAALKLKAGVFQDLLGDARARNLERVDFEALSVLMATVRRRIGLVLDATD